MAKTNFAQKLKELFTGMHAKIPAEFFDELTDDLIEGDLGAKTAYELVEMLENSCKKNNITDTEKIAAELKKMIRELVLSVDLHPPHNKQCIYLVLGVNGVGKTTSVAKLARYFERSAGVPIVLAAADTFRAAAIEQLQIHGERLGIRVVAHQNGSDPSAVVFDAAEVIAAKGGGLVLVDTAGRLHNKENLVRELQKIDRIAASKADEGCYKKILIIDSTTGQNGLRQAEVFHEAVGVDAVILTKYDSTAKGGIAAAIGKELHIPIAFIGTGETYNDLMPFDVDTYVNEFVGY